MTRWTVDGLTARLERFRLGPVDLDLAPGRVTAVLGSSGAGKTTLLRALAGFVPIEAGRIVRDGADVTARPPEARRLGYVPQGLGLFPHRTVERNVSYAFEVKGVVDWRARTRPFLERFDLLPLARRYPARLSGGEAERVALARALAAEPDLVLWDEPWQGLDVEVRHELGLVIEELRATERIPVVLVTHDPTLAFSVGDEFVVLRDGAVVFRGDGARLLAAPTDAFLARFVGFENVVAPADLEDAAAGSLAAWLAERAGPGGVAFPRPWVDAAGPWEGVVRSARPTPEGLRLTVRAGALSVALALPPPWPTPIPAVGDRVRFDLRAEALRPLGAEGAGS